MPDLTYKNWLEGFFTGDPEKIGFNAKELGKIRQEQKRIFDEKVEKVYSSMLDSFSKKEAESIDKDKYRASEIEAFDYLLNTDLQPFKGGPQQIMPIGRLKISISYVQEIRKQYNLAVNGELDHRSIASPNQQVNVPSMVTIEKCMVDAVAFSRYLEFLKNPKLIKNSSEYFSENELSSLHSKIDEVLKRISEMDFRNQHGQEIIYNEIEDLKNLPALKKKTWDEIVKGKIVKIAIGKLTDPRFLDWLHKELTGTEFTLLK